MKVNTNKVFLMSFKITGEKGKIMTYFSKNKKLCAEKYIVNMDKQ